MLGSPSTGLEELEGWLPEEFCELLARLDSVSVTLGETGLFESGEDACCDPSAFELDLF